ncbi:MAG TPA: hypothetical protein VM733_14950, partial [Thermoanaerobaculia bacterium]|nr:hypothetical protein [Thermoanaerobaculia bacterium]
MNAVTSDMVGVDDAVAQLRRYVYRSVIVHTRAALNDALLEELVTSVRWLNAVTVALLASSTPVEGASDWAQIVVQHSVDMRTLAMMVRSLLRN